MVSTTPLGDKKRAHVYRQFRPYYRNSEETEILGKVTEDYEVHGVKNRNF